MVWTIIAQAAALLVASSHLNQSEGELESRAWSLGQLVCNCDGGGFLTADHDGVVASNNISVIEKVKGGVLAIVGLLRVESWSIVPADCHFKIETDLLVVWIWQRIVSCESEIDINTLLSDKAGVKCGYRGSVEVRRRVKGALVLVIGNVHNCVSQRVGINGIVNGVPISDGVDFAVQIVL